MPRIGSIISVYNSALSSINQLQHYYFLCLSLPTASLRGFTGELIMLRLYSILEKTFQDISTRVACGCSYRNGASPSPIYHCRSIDDALNKFCSYNRRRSLLYAKFSNPTDVTKTTKYVIPATEPFINYINVHTAKIDEMRYVRNHIAHRKSSTYLQYKNVIISRYGAYFKITPAALLLSTKRRSTPILQEYFVWAKLIIADLSNG